MQLLFFSDVNFIFLNKNPSDATTLESGHELLRSSNLISQGDERSGKTKVTKDVKYQHFAKQKFECFNPLFISTSIFYKKILVIIYFFTVFFLTTCHPIINMPGKFLFRSFGIQIILCTITAGVILLKYKYLYFYYCIYINSIKRN